MAYLNRAIADGYAFITGDEGKQWITYVSSDNHKEKYSDPEEQVRAEFWAELIYEYDYPANRIKIEVTIPDRVPTDRADIVIFSDDECKKPYAVVECKKDGVTDAEFLQAIEQGVGNATWVKLRASYVVIIAGATRRVLDFSDTETGIYERENNIIADLPKSYGKPQEFRFYKGGILTESDGKKKAVPDIKPVAREDLIAAIKKCHNTLWGGGRLSPPTAFGELCKLIFVKISDEQKPRKNGEPYAFQIFDIEKPKNATQKDIDAIGQQITTELAERILGLYEEGRNRDKEVFKDNIRLTPQRIRTVVSYLQGANLSKTDLDSKGKAFETFMGSYFRGDFGQYFTPRNIVKFIVDVLPITNDSKVLDTSCGSGGFLLYALDKVRQQAGLYYDEGTIDHYNHWHDFASENLFGIEINEQIARTAKMNMIIHDDGHTNVISSDGLLRDSVIIEKTENKGFEYGTFDVIITNPPFGSTVKQTEKAYLHQYSFGNKDVDWLDTKTSAVKERDSQSTEVLFIEQDKNFLKEGGYLAIVIPDGILTNSSLQYVRDNIEEWFRIVAVISMPQDAFKANGAGVKSSVMILKKWTNEQSQKIIDTKLKLQEQIKSEAKYKAVVEHWEKEKKEVIKNLSGFENTTGLHDKKSIEKSEAFAEWKKQVTDQYNQKIVDLKEQLEERYAEMRKTAMPDYPIFMAIAEQIGYDATGKETQVNELEMIGTELKKFIESL